VCSKTQREAVIEFEEARITLIHFPVTHFLKQNVREVVSIVVNLSVKKNSVQKKYINGPHGTLGPEWGGFFLTRQKTIKRFKFRQKCDYLFAMYFKYLLISIYLCLGWRIKHFYCHLVGYKKISHHSTTENWLDEVDR
jgi:hypothetical protein